MLWKKFATQNQMKENTMKPLTFVIAMAAAGPLACTPATPGSNTASSTVPVLDYSEPNDFFRLGGRCPVEYSSREVNCSIEVYPFRVCQGDMRTEFQQTLLRNLIDPRYRESQLAAPPSFSTVDIPGADFALAAGFCESPVGIPNARLRVLVVTGNQAAIVDVVANSAYCWQKAYPAVNAMLRSLRVQTQSAPPSVADGPGPGGEALAGLYMGFKGKYTTDLFGGPASGYFVNALHYYLFSPDGRVHCCYDFPPGPNHDWRHFDFDDAQRFDPDNTGRYTVRGNQLIIQMTAPSSDPITATINDRKHIKIENVNYERKT